MSFFIVPAMSYQQQQKMKSMPKNHPRRKKSSKSSSSGASEPPLSRTASLAKEPSRSSVSVHSNADSAPVSLPANVPATVEEKPPSFFQRFSSTSRRRSEASSVGFPSLSSRRPSAASDASRGSSHTGPHSTFSGFTSLKSAPKVPELAADEEMADGASLVGGRATDKESIPENIPETTPETDPETAPGVVSKTGPETHVKAAPQAINETTQEAPVRDSSAPDSVPASVSASDPVSVPASVPVSVPGSESVSHERKPIPEYDPFTDSSVFNSEESLRKTFLYSRLPLQKFEDFLDIITDHHVNDPINFATVREHSLAKFLGRRDAGLQTLWTSMSDEDKKDRSRLQCFLSLELLKCRSILRTAIKLKLQSKSRYRKLACEQLIQGNYMNYIRYIIALPECTAEQSETLSETQKRDYEIKNGFTNLADAFYALKKDNYEGDISTLTSRVELLLSEVKKTAIDFVLLEKYTIQILVKLNNDFLIESRITKHLFNLYDLNVHLGKSESLKVLVFNSSFSSDYSWYLAITLPFVRVFEVSLLNENVSFVEEDLDDSSSLPSSASQTSLQEADDDLYKTYFSRLNLSDYATFTKMSRKELVLLHRRFSNKVNPGKISVKPINFEYYAHSMSTIRSETFRVIQSRDFTSQISSANYENMLREFYRLLKKGGVLELPMFITGVGNFGTLNNESNQTKDDSSSSISDEKCAEWSSNFTFDSVKGIISSLGELFGAHNVKFTSALLNSRNQMNAFLIKYMEMSLHESFNDVDHFQAFKESIGNLGKTGADDIHFYFYIRAEKL